MRDALAERLLAAVMDWSAEDVARERPTLQALALLKYDEYQQFSPGMRFVESLALWLAQFEPNERRIAYDFIRSRLVFFSHAEMAHFAAVMYPDFIRPEILARAAGLDGVAPYLVERIARGDTYQCLQASTLYFGLSDGARIDQFRRSNRELSHEQIFQSYEISSERVAEVKKWLAKQGTADRPVPFIVLLDDFAGSGTSYVRREGDHLAGKIVKLLERVTANAEWRDIVKFPETTVIVALYVATKQALDNIQDGTAELQQTFGATFDVLPVQLLDERTRITSESPEEFVRLVERYYDPKADDEHTAKGSTDVKYGFASCGLPVVLYHNTPNNSLYLLWAEDSQLVRPLFERFSRHRRES